ncbi:MAG: hypothetical protein C0401_06385 [Anaerolinea sp.]|nr:hypothetical protein [Anaerolinea sp.]
MSDTPSHSKRIALILTNLFFIGALASCRQAIHPTQQPVAQSTPSTTDSLDITAYPKPELTQTPIPCVKTIGSIVEREIPTVLLEKSINVKIYLPPCYNSNLQADFPVLYMLHGQTSANDQWLRLGLFSEMDELLMQKAIQPFLIVLPYESRSNTDSDVSKYGEALVQDVIPYIEDNFRVCKDRSCRAIGGLSRGGNWAVHLGFTYPKRFVAIGAHSTPLFYGEIIKITERVSAISSTTELPAIYIDMGNKDPDRQDVLAFVAALKKLNIPYQFTEFLGYHQEDYWSAHVQDYLFWYSNQLMSATQE